MKNIISSLPNYILMLRARTMNGTKMATQKKREDVKYIQIEMEQDYNKYIMSVCELQNK